MRNAVTGAGTSNDGKGKIASASVARNRRKINDGDKNQAAVFGKFQVPP